MNRREYFTIIDVARRAHKIWARKMELAFLNGDVDVFKQFNWWKSYIISEPDGNVCFECGIAVNSRFENAAGCVWCDVCFEPMLFHEQHTFVLKEHAPLLFVVVDRMKRVYRRLS